MILNRSFDKLSNTRTRQVLAKMGGGGKGATVGEVVCEERP